MHSLTKISNFILHMCLIITSTITFPACIIGLVASITKHRAIANSMDYVWFGGTILILCVLPTWLILTIYDSRKNNEN